MTHIEQRIDEASVLASVNPTDIHKGEAVHESDTGRWKIGDGASAYNDLPYKAGVDSVAGKTGNVDLVVADVDGAAPLADPVFTGTPKVPTRATSDDSTNIASTAFVKAVVAALVDASPATLDTLNELAAALGDDPNFATTMTTALGLKAPLASPVFTGNPTAPTPSTSDNDTSLATTAFVKAVLARTETDPTWDSMVTGSVASRLVLDNRKVIASFDFTVNKNWPTYADSVCNVPVNYRPFAQWELTLFSAATGAAYPMILQAGGSLQARVAIPTGTTLVGSDVWPVP